MWDYIYVEVINLEKNYQNISWNIGIRRIHNITF
jgi:hypothetical protein